MNNLFKRAEFSGTMSLGKDGEEIVPVGLLFKPGKPIKIICDNLTYTSNKSSIINGTLDDGDSFSVIQWPPLGRIKDGNIIRCDYLVKGKSTEIINNINEISFQINKIPYQLLRNTPFHLDIITGPKDTKVEINNLPPTANQDIIQVAVKFTDVTDINQAYSTAIKICNLFSLLTFRPTYPLNLKLTTRENDINSLFPALLLQKTTLKSAKTSWKPQWLKLEADGDIQSIFKTWMKSDLSDSIVIQAIQCENGLRNRLVTHAEILIYSTGLESIAQSIKSGNSSSNKTSHDNKRKYTDPIEKYASPEIISTLHKIFKVDNNAALGVKISDLRNDIAHVGRAPKILNSLSQRSLMIVATNMRLVIIGGMLASLGLNKSLINSYAAYNEISW